MARIPFLGKKAPAGVVSMMPLDQVLELLQAQNRANSSHGEKNQTPLPAPELWSQTPFGPGARIRPAAITELRPDTDRSEPQVYEYPVSWNLQITENRLIPWRTLRTASYSPLVRPIIRKRQRDLCKLPWDITVKRSVIEEAARASGDGSANAASKLAKAMAPDISKARTFWENPDPVAGLDFADWFMQLIEEQLVLDAVAIYPETTYGGDLYGLRVIDGTTIKPLLNEYGRRPETPYPAFQQMLYGFPRGEFTADVGVDDPGVLTADQLIYRKQYVRTFSPYGLSPVESALLDIDLFLKRHGWMRSEYTEGTLAEAYLKTYGETQTQWSPQQLLEYERALNDSMSGSTAERHRMRMLPPGWEPAAQSDVSERYKADYDLYVIQLVCSHFGERAERLGFTQANPGKGTANQADEVSAESGLFPDAKWWMKVFTSISHKYLGMPKELEFRFMDVEEEDLGTADAMAENRVQSGRMTFNEERDRLGLPRYTDPLADIPVIVTRKGVQPLTMAGIEQANAADNAAAPGLPSKQPGQLGGTAGAQETPANAQSALEGRNQISGSGKALPAEPSKPARKGQLTLPDGSQHHVSDVASALASHRHATKAKGAEISTVPDVRELAQSEMRAYKNWVTKRSNITRPFEFTSDADLVKDLDPDLDLSAAVFKHSSAASDHAVRHDVHALMSESFPPEFIEWVKNADWEGPKHVDIDKVNMDDVHSWAAWHDHIKVTRIAKKLSAGKPQKKPAIMVKRGDKFDVVDGHHHVLGAIKAGVEPVAYLGTVDKGQLSAALETHTHQFPKPESTSNAG